MTGLGYTNKIYNQKVMTTRDENHKQKKVCAICGKEFVPLDPRNKFCSLLCKEAARKLNRDRWRDSHPGYNTEYMREYRKRTK